MGSYSQSGGKALLTGTNALYVGNAAGSIGTYSLSGTGFLDATGKNEYVGYSGTGAFTQTGGTNKAASLTVGANQGSVGAYSMQAGALSVAGDERIGQSGTGTFTQTGGANAIGGTLYIGMNSGSSGTYTFTGGALTGADMTIRGDAAASGTFQGNGTVGMAGILTNNGRVIADGYGSEKTLDMSGFDTVTNSLTNAGTNGWFAQNKGKLALPSLTIETEDGTYNWGEDPGAGTISFVNSIQLTFTGLDTGGSLDASLLATDRSEVTYVKGLADLVGYWDISAPGIIFGTGSVDMVFRYDDALASQLGITESDLKMGHFVTDRWEDATTGIDTANNLIYAAGVTSFSPFAVGSNFDYTVVDRYWQAETGDWAADENWTDGAPGAGQNAFINNSGASNVTTAASVNFLTIGAGTININSGGTLSVASMVNGTGNGTLNIDGGALSVTSASIDVDSFNVGYATGAAGSFTLASGKTLTAATVGLGNYGAGTLTLNGGTATVSGSITGGSGTGTLNIDGGVLNGTYTALAVDNLRVGYAGTGAFTQSGSAVSATNVDIGYLSGASGTYTQIGGTTIISGSLNVGAVTGTTGTYEYKGGTLTDSAADANVTVGVGPYASGTFQGYGTVDMSGTLTNNGKVIADGGGVANTLDLSAFSAIENTIDNPTDGVNGWYAQNKGKLVLNSLSIAEDPGDVSYFWGEDPSDADGIPDLVSSMKLTFHNVTEAGTLDISLLAKDSPEAPEDMSVYDTMALWDFTASPSLEFDSFDLLIRYDTSFGYLADQMKFYWYHGGGWLFTNSTFNDTDKTITVVGLTGFSNGYNGGPGPAPNATPEPVTVLSFIAGIAVLAYRKVFKRK